MRRQMIALIGVLAILAGCEGESESPRTLTGGTYKKDLGLTLVVDQVELGEDAALAYITIRNPAADYFMIEPFESVLTVDGQRYEGFPSSDHPTIEPKVGAGGGESTGVLEFPDAPMDATSYELQVRWSSENTTVGDNGLVVWDVTLA